MFVLLLCVFLGNTQRITAIRRYNIVNFSIVPTSNNFRIVNDTLDADFRRVSQKNLLSGYLMSSQRIVCISLMTVTYTRIPADEHLGAMKFSQQCQRRLESFGQSRRVGGRLCLHLLGQAGPGTNLLCIWYRYTAPKRLRLFISQYGITS
jgi:hypothetical protein